MNGQPSPYSDQLGLAQVTLSVGPAGQGRISVNGVDLSHVVSSARVETHAGHLTDVVIIVSACHVTVEAEAALRAYIVRDDREVTTLGDEVRRFQPDEPEHRGGCAGAQQE